MATRFVCVVFHRRSPATGEMEFLVVDSRSSDPRTGRGSQVQVKFPGGTNQEHPGELVEETRDREAWEETRLAFLMSKQILMRVVGSHTRYGFLVDYDRDCRGEVRTCPMLDDGRDELAAPRWVVAEVLEQELFHSHREFFVAACHELGIVF